MSFSHVLIGLATGLPVMIVVGPIALLLVEEGMERGIRRSAPAILGVTSVDLLFSSVAAFAGAGVVSVLEPVEGGLKVLATCVLTFLAVTIWRGARTDLRTAGTDLAAPREPAASRPEFELVAVDAMSLAVSAPALDELTGDSAGVDAVSNQSAFTGDSLGRSARRMARFFGATALNPITILVFTSLVISGRDGVGTPGWVLGMTLASLLVGMTFVAIGHGLGAVLNQRATAQLRMGGGVLIGAMAIWFLFA